MENNKKEKQKKENLENIEEIEPKVPLIFEKSKKGRRSFRLPELDIPAKDIKELIPEKFLRKQEPELPELDTLSIVRHFTILSKRNIGVDSHFYPLGSCTMKYNPKINEKVVTFKGFTFIHPYQPEETVQGILQLLYETQEYLKDIAGLSYVSLMPAAGAHGELTSLMLIKAYHKNKKREPKIILIPDSAHGTNPASSTLCGYKVKTIKTSSKGYLKAEDIKPYLSEDIAGLMITNPNTLGIFEKDIIKITDLLHEIDALVYMDGANMNALLGIAKPGDFGIDVMHYNLHKTFSTPHGGGGPGSGPIAVNDKLKDFLPGYIIEKQESNGKSRYYLKKMEKSIGRTRGFIGSIGVIIKAYTYIRDLGKEGISQIGKIAVLNANYLAHHLKKYYNLHYDRDCMHEFVLSASIQKKNKVRALDIAKRLLDLDFHPPTIYFPLIVPEALMIEPTETESKETLDNFIKAMIQIAEESKEEPWKVQEAPYLTPVMRLDEVRAARQPILRWEKDKKE